MTHLIVREPMGCCVMADRASHATALCSDEMTPNIGPRCMRVLIRPRSPGTFTSQRVCHTAESIIGKLKTAEQLIAQANTVADVCRLIEVVQSIYHCLKQQFGGMQVEEAKRLTQLEEANARLKSFFQKTCWSRRCSSRRPCVPCFGC